MAVGLVKEALEPLPLMELNPAKHVLKTQAGPFSVDDLADVGTDDGTWVANYGSSAKFNGKLNKVTITVSDAKQTAMDAKKEVEMKKQLAQRD